LKSQKFLHVKRDKYIFENWEERERERAEKKCCKKCKQISYGTRRAYNTKQ